MRDNKRQKEIREKVVLKITNEKNEANKLYLQPEVIDYMAWCKKLDVIFIWIPIAILLIVVTLQMFWDLLHGITIWG